MLLRKCFIFVATIKLSCATLYSNTSLIISPRDSGGWGWGHESGGSGGSTSVHSFFDIALTALAFLSFGIFLLNLLMNALFLTTATTGLTSTGPIITTGIDTGTMGGDGGATTDPPVDNATVVYIRGKRETLEFIVDRPSAANALALSVLKSIDAMVEKHECLPKVFCDGNRQAELVGHGFQFLMPLLSLSSSFIGEKLGFHKNLPEHVDAILYGITESNCRSQFPKCSG